MKLLLSILVLLLLLALGTKLVALHHSHPLAHGGRPVVVRKSAQAEAVPKVVRRVAR